VQVIIDTTFRQYTGNMTLSPKTLLTKLALILLFTTVHAHVGLRTPCGRYQSAPGCPTPPPGQVVDYNINSPIGTNLRIDFPLCKATVPYPFESRAVYKAGDTIQTAYSIGAPHGGGHCQWALSYDGEKTWVVIKTEIRTCLQITPDMYDSYRIPVKLPIDAPSGNVTFMWLWINAIGDRELYSNCADIWIDGQNGGSVRGVAPLIADYGSSYPTFPEFPTAEFPDSHELFATRKRVTINVTGSDGGLIGPTPTSTALTPSATARENNASYCLSTLTTFWTSTVLFVSSFLIYFASN
jgi:hypothetical protein